MKEETIHQKAIRLVKGECVQNDSYVVRRVSNYTVNNDCFMCELDNLSSKEKCRLSCLCKGCDNISQEGGVLEIVRLIY